MSGAHRRPDEDPVVSVLLAIWWWLWRLVITAAIAAILPGVLALIIYLAVSGRELAALAIVWLGLVATLVTVIIRRQDEGRLKWTTAGLLLTITWQLVDAFGRERHWPAGQLQQIDMIGRIIQVVSIAYFVVAILIWIRSNSSRWRDRGSSVP